jgi:hypothetical protein
MAIARVIMTTKLGPGVFLSVRRAWRISKRQSPDQR